MKAKELMEKAEGLSVDSYVRFDVDILDDFPESGYYTAFVWSQCGVARTAEKAVAFALANLSEAIKKGEEEL